MNALTIEVHITDSRGPSCFINGQIVQIQNTPFRDGHRVVTITLHTGYRLTLYGHPSAFNDLAKQLESEEAL